MTDQITLHQPLNFDASSGATLSRVAYKTGEAITIDRAEYSVTEPDMVAAICNLPEGCFAGNRRLWQAS